MIEIWTDGSCEPNPGRGGWAWVRKYDSFICSGSEEETTNNRMELMAIINAIEFNHSVPVKIYSDSDYCIKGAISWSVKWEKKQWKNVKNADLWQRLRLLLNERTLPILFEWVKGHGNDPMNYLADREARRAMGRVPIKYAELKRTWRGH